MKQPADGSADRRHPCKSPGGHRPSAAVIRTVRSRRKARHALPCPAVVHAGGGGPHSNRIQTCTKAECLLFPGSAQKCADGLRHTNAFVHFCSRQPRSFAAVAPFLRGAAACRFHGSPVLGRVAPIIRELSRAATCQALCGSADTEAARSAQRCCRSPERSARTNPDRSGKMRIRAAQTAAPCG